MTQLTFYFSSPCDLVAKLRRDHTRLSNALSTGDKEKIADCIFDFSNTGYSLKEWLKENTNTNFSPRNVEDYVRETPALDACRDICNANKHYRISNYVPLASNVYASATATTSAPFSVPGNGLALETEPDHPFKVKVLLSDGTKFEVLDFGQKVIDAWDAFISAKDVQ